MCNESKKACVCTVGSAKCDGNSLTICRADSTWGTPTECSGDTPVCDAAKKACVCTEGTAKCDENGLSICGADGTWGAPTECKDNTPVCSAQEKKCMACTEGTAKCDENGLSICGADGAWGEPTECKDNTPVCSAQEKKCLPCTEGEAKCDDKGLSICGADGAWGDPRQCKPDTPYCNADLKACLACNPGVDICTGSGKQIGMHECKADGTVGNLIDGSCPTLRCLPDGSACTECTDGEKRCDMDANAIVTCVDGRWNLDKAEACDRGLICGDSGKGPECRCEPGSLICAFDGRAEGIYRCTEKGGLPPSNSSDYLVDYCPCTPEGCACQKDGDMCLSKGQGVATCKDGMWLTSSLTMCDDGLRCDDSGDAAVCACEPNSVVCAYHGKGRGLYRCTEKGTLPGYNNMDYLVTRCDCTPEGCPCEQEGARSCMLNPDLTVCRNGYWKKDDTLSCDKNQRCSDAIGGVCIDWNYCNEGETICDGDTLMECQNDFFTVVQECDHYCISDNIARGSRKAQCVENPQGVQTCHKGDAWTFDGDGNAKHTTCSDSETCVLVEDESLQLKTKIAAVCNANKCKGKFVCDKSTLNVCNNNALVPLADCKKYGMQCDDKVGKCVLLTPIIKE